MFRRITNSLLALGLVFSAGIASAASGRTTDKSYKTARMAALRTAAYEMNRGAVVRETIGTMTASRLIDRGVVSTSKGGVAERHLVETQKRAARGSSLPFAQTIVSVRKAKRGWVGYTDGLVDVVLGAVAQAQ